MNQTDSAACPLVTKETAQRVLEVVDQGLSSGLGKPIPGQMCVEAAVCYAMGLPHSDQPTCVAPAVRSFKIALNDKNWSSKAARAAGLRRVAVAQLGSAHIDNKAFATEVTIQVTRQLLPIALRAAASLANASHSVALELAATVCETVTDLASVKAAASQARSAAYAAYAANAAANAANAAAYAANAAANAAYAANGAAYAAANAAYAAAYAAYAAAYAAKAATRDSILSKAAEIGVQALVKLGAQGAQWLYLCD